MGCPWTAGSTKGQSHPTPRGQFKDGRKQECDVLLQLYTLCCWGHSIGFSVSLAGHGGSQTTKAPDKEAKWGWAYALLTFLCTRRIRPREAAASPVCKAQLRRNLFATPSREGESKISAGPQRAERTHPSSSHLSPKIYTFLLLIIRLYYCIWA